MTDKQVVFEGLELNTVEILHQAREMARIMGYEIREEWLAGSGGDRNCTDSRRSATKYAWSLSDVPSDWRSICNGIRTFTWFLD